jgi:surface antigen
VNNVPTTLVSGTINDKDDYLIQSPADDKYYYWKHIDNEWHLMGGAGNSSGGGNSSGFVYTAEAYEELEEKEANTDYYVLESDGYHHYRWVNNEEIEIVEPNTKYNIAIESVESDGTTINYLNLYEFHPGDDTTIDDNTVLDTLLAKRIRHILLPATVGGGGIVNNMKITSITARNMYIAYGSNSPAKIRFFFTTGEANEPVNYNILINGESILSEPVNITSGDPINKAYTWPVDENTGEELSPADAAALGFYEIDIADYCKAIGTYTVKLVIALDSNLAITSESNWTVRTINLGLTSNYTNNPVVEVGSNLVFNYIPSGNIEKVAHFVLNNTELPSVTLEAKVNTTQNYTIPAQMVAGAYKLKVYLTANNGAIETDPIYRDIIWQDSNSSDIIIASPYRGNTENIQQYNTLNIPYTIIGGTGSTYNVKYYVDDFSQSINEVTLTNTNNGTWAYRANDSGNHTLKIECEETSITINLVVRPLDIDIAPVTANLAIDFNPSGITNTSSKRLWSNDNYSMTVSDNFDWYNGGYGSDAAGDYFLIKAGTRATFDYKMFKSYNRTIDGAVTTSSTVFRDGLEMKLIFKTSAVRNAEAVWFTNVGPTNDTSAAKNVGIQLNVHNGWLKTDAAEEGNTKSYLYFPYSEEDRIELDININPETATNAVYLMSYEDGCPSRAYPYKTSEALYQINNEESPIVIGSDDCDVYIYRFKIYNAALDTEDVLRNFIADGKDVSTCLERYERNSIYYDTQNEEYSPYMGPDCVLDPVKLAYKIPDVKILMLDAPTFTVNKKTFIKDSTLRCIHAPGGKIYPSRGKEDNWFFGNGYHAGQGTTSDKYGDAGCNLDFLFNCDGIHKPSDKVNPIENYVSYVIKGYGTNEQEEPEYCTDWKGNTGKVSLTATSVPNNFFNLKVNIASSENVNKALFQKRYNDFLLDLFESLAYKRDNRIKNDMEFVPAILFVRENDPVTSIETVDN